MQIKIYFILNKKFKWHDAQIFRSGIRSDNRKVYRLWHVIKLTCQFFMRSEKLEQNETKYLRSTFSNDTLPLIPYLRYENVICHLA